MGKKAHTDFDVFHFVFAWINNNNKKYTYIYINWEDNLSFDSEWRLRLKPFSQRTAGPRYLITPRECLLCGAFVEVLEELVKYTRGPERQMADFQD